MYADLDPARRRAVRLMLLALWWYFWGLSPAVVTPGELVAFTLAVQQTETWSAAVKRAVALPPDAASRIATDDEEIWSAGVVQTYPFLLTIQTAETWSAPE
jgi:hypothetical protein